MAPAANPLDDPADLDALGGYAATLLAAIEVSLPTWVQRSVADRWSAAHGGEPPAEVSAAAADAGEAAAHDVLPALRELLALDVAEQASNPLAIVRRAVVHPTRVLAAAEVPPRRRDPHAERLFPDDVYDLVPGAFSDLDPSVHEPGLHWGAAKAHVLIRRRRATQPG